MNTINSDAILICFLTYAEVHVCVTQHSVSLWQMFICSVQVMCLS